MAVYQEGSNVVVDASVAGSVFPRSERELPIPILLDGTKAPIRIGGAVYSRAFEARGAVQVDGPIVSRGDARLSPGAGQILLLSGLTVNGSLLCEHESGGATPFNVANAASAFSRDRSNPARCFDVPSNRRF